ncbi:MAG: DUF2783 domain-containing protein [Xenophilus sp.]
MKLSDLAPAGTQPLDAQQDLATGQSHAFNARLVRLLAHHIGSLSALREALAAAREH